jgi:hypothetical protein
MAPRARRSESTTNPPGDYPGLIRYKDEVAVAVEPSDMCESTSEKPTIDLYYPPDDSDVDSACDSISEKPPIDLEYPPDYYNVDGAYVESAYAESNLDAATDVSYDDAYDSHDDFSCHSSDDSSWFWLMDEAQLEKDHRPPHGQLVQHYVLGVGCILFNI